ncbi:hypothetical protein [Desulfosarcina sp.]|uniref:hypothetical protein n=1 Tax=Desulfosarcina sp. TaxID=2027861 RepID=UPI0039706D61
MRTIFLAALIFSALLLSNAWGDLTGRWTCNDGGTYYLRQNGRQIRWYGESADVQPAWSNVFSGQIQKDRIQGSWTDVPKGRSAGSGSLELVIEKHGAALRAVKKTGGFIGSRWTRSMVDAAADRPRKPIESSGNEDCIRFNPAAIRVHDVNGRWKLVDGNHWLFDFESDPAAAHKALKVIRHYRMDRACFVGRFTYMLAKGGSPSGAMAEEECIAFDPMAATVSKVQGNWKILAGRRWLFDFAQNETQARQALAVIRKKGFSQSCFVGRSDAGFTYLRR